MSWCEAFSLAGLVVILAICGAIVGLVLYMLATTAPWALSLPLMFIGLALLCKYTRLGKWVKSWF